MWLTYLHGTAELGEHFVHHRRGPLPGCPHPSRGRWQRGGTRPAHEELAHEARALGEAPGPSSRVCAGVSTGKTGCCPVLSAARPPGRVSNPIIVIAFAACAPAAKCLPSASFRKVVRVMPSASTRIVSTSAGSAPSALMKSSTKANGTFAAIMRLGTGPEVRVDAVDIDRGDAPTPFRRAAVLPSPLLKVRRETDVDDSASFVAV